MAFFRVLEYAHKLVEERIKQGDIAVDATCGNGHDIVFLAKLVCETGVVYGFDIQQQAIANTINRLEENDLTHRVKCIQEDHENIDKWIEYPISAAMFNLGYLPGSDKTIKTEPTKTIQAIETLLKRLKVKGIITIVVYTEHDNGYEASQLENYLSALPQKIFSIIKYGFVNQIHHPPFLIAIEKNKEL